MGGIGLCPNMSLLDRVIRMFVGLALVLVSPIGFDLIPSATLSWFLAVFGSFNVASAVIKWCPMYRLVGISSNGSVQARHANRVDADPDDAKPVETLTSLRRKTVAGFGAITLLVSGVFLYESYASALSVARILEVEQLHENTLILERIFKEYSTEDSESVVRAELEKTVLDAGINLVLASNRHHEIVLNNGLSAGNFEVLIRESRSRQIAEPIVEKSTSVHTKREAISKGISQYVYTDNKQDYVFMTHQGADDFAVTVVKESGARPIVVDFLVGRVALSSAVVIWLGLWGGYGIALFIWRRIDESNQNIVKAANTDAATGLPNERCLKAEFTARFTAGEFKKAKVYLFQCRTYQQVITDYGSELASQLITAMAERISAANVKTRLLARLNDGNIMVILPENDDQQRLSTRELMLELEKPVRLGSYMFSIEPTKISLWFPRDGADVETLIKNAALTLSRANRDRITALNFMPDFSVSNRKRYQYASEIRTALIDGDLELYFQPKINLKTNQPDAVEALIRWNHKEDGLLYPAQFLDVVEDSNARKEFCMSVIEQAVTARRQLEAQGHDIAIAFNMSSYDVVNAEILDKFKQAVAAAGVAYSSFQIELTEGETTVNLEAIVEALEIYTALGCKIAMDDFGMGMSSLSYCHRLPIDTVKIDRSFTQRLIGEQSSRVMMQAIMDMSRHFNWHVVAEGVETAEVADIVVELGCDYGQGYLYAKPMPFESLVSFLNRHA